MEPSRIGNLTDFLLLISQFFLHWCVIRGIDYWLWIRLSNFRGYIWDFLFDLFRHVFEFWSLRDMVSTLWCFWIYWILRIHRKPILWIPEVFLFFKSVWLAQWTFIGHSLILRSRLIISHILDTAVDWLAHPTLFWLSTMFQNGWIVFSFLFYLFLSLPDRSKWIFACLYLLFLL